MIYLTTDINDLKKVIELQQKFIDESICNGISLDDISALSQQLVFVIKIKNKIIGYAYGKIEIAKKDKSYCKKGDKSFYIEEIYIDKASRNKGYGKKLYLFIENFAKQNDCKNIQVVAVSKDYNRLLKFYINELSFNFWSAWLIKNI